MSSSELPDFIHQLISRVIKEHEFSNYSIDIKPNSEIGFGSEMFNIKISENSSDKWLNVLCKVAPFDAARREMCISNIIFKREALFYENVVSTFTKFQVEKSLTKDNQFSSYPKCFATTLDDVNEHYAIVMEHLEPFGFKLWDKANPLPVAGLRLIMRELGKFHGISFALKDQKPDQFSEFKHLKDTLGNFLQSDNIKSLWNGSFDLALKALKNDYHKEIIRDVQTNFTTYFDYCVNSDICDRFDVLSHGDLNSNNLLYKFNGSGIIEDIRIVDWQSIRYVSPVLDILYCILPCTDKQIRDQEYDNLIKLYHDSLSKTIKLLGSNPDELFTLENLRSELKRCGNYCLLMGPMLLQAYLVGLELDPAAKAEDFSDYVQRINDLIGDIVDLEYYRKHDLSRTWNCF